MDYQLLIETNIMRLGVTRTQQTDEASPLTKYRYLTEVTGAQSLGIREASFQLQKCHPWIWEGLESGDERKQY